MVSLWHCRVRATHFHSLPVFKFEWKVSTYDAFQKHNSFHFFRLKIRMKPRFNIRVYWFRVAESIYTSWWARIYRIRLYIHVVYTEWLSGIYFVLSKIIRTTSLQDNFTGSAKHEKCRIVESKKNKNLLLKSLVLSSCDNVAVSNF